MRIIRVVHLAYLHNQSPFGSPPALESTCTAGAALFLYPYTHSTPFDYYSRGRAAGIVNTPLRAKPRQIRNANAPEHTRTQPYACVFLKQNFARDLVAGQKRQHDMSQKNSTLFASPNCAAERQAVMLSCRKLRREVKASSRKEDEASLKCTSKHRNIEAAMSRI